ncbi:hypothetical protein BC834DRAFT_884338 [Gloeopeniophorella convolvens]|nr:hypothetical protein BC834DRAFT_884338 [Gloeopeniophorella convolvens]
MPILSSTPRMALLSECITRSSKNPPPSSLKHYLNSTTPLTIPTPRSPPLHPPEKTLRSLVLLAAILPVPIFLPPTFERAIPALVAAKKYKADAALSTLRLCLDGRIYDMVKPEDAFRVFCLARRSGLLREALAPAKVALDHPITIEGLGDKLLFASATSLHELVSLERRIQSNLNSSISGLRGTVNVLEGIWGALGEWCSDFFRSSIPQWVDHAVALLASSTHPVLDQRVFYVVLQSHINDCPSCGEIPTSFITEFWSLISRMARAAISQAETDFMEEQDASPPRSLDFLPPPHGSSEYYQWRGVRH